MIGTWALWLELQQPYCIFGMTMRKKPGTVSRWKRFLDLWLFSRAMIPSLKCCASYLLLHKKWPQIYQLKTTPVYYLTISLGCESGHGLGPWAKDPLRVSQGCSQGFSQAAFSSGGLTEGRICFQAHSGCWQNSYPRSCRTEVSIFMLAVGQGLLSTSSSGLCHVAVSIVHNMSVSFLEASRRISLFRKGFF